MHTLVTLAALPLSYTLAGAAQPVTVTAYNSLTLAPLQQLAAGVYLLQGRTGSPFSSQRVVV